MINEEFTREKITSFKELLNEICWSYQYPLYDIVDHEDGTYSLNKLHITPIEASYKTDIYEITPDVYDDFIGFVHFLKSTERK